MTSIGYLFQWNSGTESRLRQPSLETVLIECLSDIFESIYDTDDEDLTRKLWNSFTLKGEYSFITDRVVESINTENLPQLKIAAIHYTNHLLYLLNEEDFEEKTNFVIANALVERVLEEMQKPSYTVRVRLAMLSLMNALLVKACDSDNDLGAEGLVDENGDHIVFNSADVSMPCFEIFYRSRGSDIILSLDFDGGSETWNSHVNKFNQRY